MVFGGGAEEGDAADVDLFDRFGEGAVGFGDGGGEGVKVADDDGDWGDGLGGEVGLVGGNVTGEDACDRDETVRFIFLCTDEWQERCLPPWTAG